LNRVGGDVRYYSDYELGHVYWVTEKPLPLDASLPMQQGYVKAAKEQDMSEVAHLRTMYRRGLWEPLPKYRYMVTGIRQYDYQYLTRADAPLKRGQAGRVVVKRAQRDALHDRKMRELA
jgi:hypothetical protein